MEGLSLFVSLSVIAVAALHEAAELNARSETRERQVRASPADLPEVAWRIIVTTPKLSNRFFAIRMADYCWRNLGIGRVIPAGHDRPPRKLIFRGIDPGQIPHSDKRARQLIYDGEVAPLQIWSEAWGIDTKNPAEPYPAHDGVI